MPEIDNHTPYEAVAYPSETREGREGLLVVAAVHFDLPDPQRSVRRSLSLSRQQLPPPLADSYWGEPGQSSLRSEGQLVTYRPGTDVCLSGHAWAPGGEPTSEVVVRFRVADLCQESVVIGDRVWEKGPEGEMVPSSPQPFVSLPLRWERAFGGVAGGEPQEGGSDEGEKALREERNPVGVGLYRSAEEAEGRALPNIECPSARVEKVEDRPAPVGFGPVPKHWEPRRSLAGTYDEAWRRCRAPFAPEDQDPRFFHAAPTELQAPTFLRGGEPVLLEGVHPKGPVSFAVPRLALVVEVELGRRREEQSLVLDAVEVDADQLRLSLIFRAMVVAQRGLMSLRRTLLRQLTRRAKGGRS